MRTNHDVHCIRAIFDGYTQVQLVEFITCMRVGFIDENCAIWIAVARATCLRKWGFA